MCLCACLFAYMRECMYVQLFRAWADAAYDAGLQISPPKISDLLAKNILHTWSYMFLSFQAGTRVYVIGRDCAAIDEQRDFNGGPCRARGTEGTCKCPWLHRCYSTEHVALYISIYTCRYIYIYAYIICTLYIYIYICICMYVCRFTYMYFT